MFPVNFSSSSLNFSRSPVMWLLSLLSRYHMLVSTWSSPSLKGFAITFSSLSINKMYFLSQLCGIMPIFSTRVTLDHTLVLPRVGTSWICEVLSRPSLPPRPRPFFSLLLLPRPLVPKKEEPSASLFLLVKE